MPRTIDRMASVQAEIQACHCQAMQKDIKIMRRQLEEIYKMTRDDHQVAYMTRVLSQKSYV